MKGDESYVTVGLLKKILWQIWEVHLVAEAVPC